MLKDIFWQVGGSIVNRASFFISLFLLSGYLQPIAYGVLGLIYNIALSISSINSTGLGIVTRRELVKQEIANKQANILFGNILLIFIISFLISLCVTIYQYKTNNITINYFLFFCLLFIVSTNASLSYYLNYHYSGLEKFKLYNILLLPVNVLLPILIICIHPTNITVPLCLIAGVLLLGNVLQILNLVKGERWNLSLAFQKENRKYYAPCFFQAILGLPVYVILQVIIVGHWQNFELIGLITIMSQVLNMSNIFASKTLTVFSPRLSRLRNEFGYVPVAPFAKILVAYLFIIMMISGVLWLFIPFIINLFQSNFAEYISEMRYFICLNVFISLVWFFVEYFHAIQKSWISLYINCAVSLFIFVIFYLFYYQAEEFTLSDYANCLAFSRIIIIMPIICLVIKVSRRRALS